MKTYLTFILFMIAFATTANSQALKPTAVELDTLEDQGLREVTNTAFKVGEKLTYRVHYGLLDAGEAVLEVKQSKYKFNGRDAYHVVGEGRSLGAFDWFFKVRDRYESYIDQEGLFPYRFIRDVSEGGYKIFQDYKFDPGKRAVKTHEEKEYLTPEFVQDMLSSFYYARSLDYSNMKHGDIITIYSYVDDEIYPLKIKYDGKEVVKLRKGDYSCLRFVPVIQEGRIFKSEEDLHVWITDDANHIPILVKSKILVGSIKMEVVEYSGLANPISKID